MLDENAPRRPRGQPLIDLAKEDLELYSVEDLQERISDLEAEIARARAMVERKRASRSAADALFGKG